MSTGRRRTKRNPDKYKAGKSSLVPYIASEAWQERHSRRKEAALEHEHTMQVWCRAHGWFMSIKNNGHHWIFKTHVKPYKEIMIEWFPSSGKLVIGKQWQKGIHCHDYKQLLEVFKEVK